MSRAPADVTIFFYFFFYFFVEYSLLNGTLPTIFLPRTRQSPFGPLYESMNGVNCVVLAQGHCMHCKLPSTRINGMQLVDTGIFNGNMRSTNKSGPQIQINNNNIIFRDVIDIFKFIYCLRWPSALKF